MKFSIQRLTHTMAHMKTSGTLKGAIIKAGSLKVFTKWLLDHQIYLTKRAGGLITRLLGMKVEEDLGVPKDHIVVLDGQSSIVDILELTPKIYEKRS